MGVDASVSDELDPDAPWRPGFEWPGWSDEPVVVRCHVPDDTATADVESWSREAVETPISWKDWVPPPELRRRAAPTRVPERAPAADVDGLPASTVTGDVFAVAVVVLAAVVVAAFALVLLPPGAAPAVPPDRDLLPARADVLWSVELGTRVGETALGSDVLVVDAGSEVVGFDRLTGDRLWTHDAGGRPLSRHLLVTDGVSVIIDDAGGRQLDLVALDVRSGAPLWTRDDPAGATEIVDGRLIEFGADTFKTRQLIDPMSGDSVGARFALGPAAAPLPRIASVVGHEVTVYDVDTGERLSPTVDGPRLRAVDVVGGVLVGFDDANKVVVFDEEGDRTDERPFTSDVFGDFIGRAELIGAVPGHESGILSSGSSIGFEIVAGNLEVIWNVDGRVGPPVETRFGPVSVARVIDAASGEVNHALVSSSTGVTLSVTDVGVTREAEPTVYWDGYVVAPEVGRTDRVLRALDFDGNPLWSLALPVSASYVVADESIVVVERGVDATAITVHG